jgi:hypothetical protein
MMPGGFGDLFGGSNWPTRYVEPMQPRMDPGSTSDPGVSGLELPAPRGSVTLPGESIPTVTLATRIDWVEGAPPTEGPSIGIEEGTRCLLELRAASANDVRCRAIVQCASVELYRTPDHVSVACTVSANTVSGVWASDDTADVTGRFPRVTVDGASSNVTVWDDREGSRYRLSMTIEGFGPVGELIR